MALPLDATAPARLPDPERRLGELVRAGAPLRRVAAALAGRLVARRAWERLGYARLGDYARERLGLSARTLQELARVDAALAGLPALESALVSGRLGWSKLRLLARCASVDDEACWIAFAERTGVRALERACRAVARGAREAEELATDEDGADTGPVEQVRVRAPVALAFAWRHAVRAAEQVAGERLGAAGALEWVTAEALSALPVGEEQAAEGDAALGAGSGGDAVFDAARGGTADGEAAGCRGAGVPLAAAAVAPQAAGAEPQGTAPRAPSPEGCELPRFLALLLEGLEAADAFELDARLRRAVRLAQRLDAEIAPLLRQVTSPEHEWRARRRTLAAFARETLGMSPRKARALLRLERLGDLCPALRTAYRAGALSWLQAQALAPLLLGDGDDGWREAWVAFAGRVTLRRLDEVVGEALALREADPLAWPRPWEDPERLDDGSPNERQVCARPTHPEASPNPLGDVWIRIPAPRAVARLFRAVLCRVRLAVERRSGQLPSEAEAFAMLLAHALEAWGVDDRRLARQLRGRLPIFERDGWRCTVPGCTSRRNLQAHHIVFRSAGGGDTPQNQTTLCAFHHQRGVHGGTLRITGQAPAALVFELGTRAGRAPLARYGSGDRHVPGGAVAALRRP